MKFNDSKSTLRTPDQYYAAFDKLHYDQKKFLFEQALENRRAEISLYWTRTAYFWAFIAFTLGGYVAIANADHFCNSEKIEFEFIASCWGLIFAFGWYLVTRGSKYWQENWEKHVDMLERYMFGALFRKTLELSEPSGFLTSPKRYSVSRINTILSLAVVMLWLYLIARSCADILQSCDQELLLRATFIGIVTFAFCVWLLSTSRSFGDSFVFKTGDPAN